MAIDPRISLAIQGPSLAPGSQVINTFQNALNQAQNRRGNQQAIDQREITNPLNAQILQQQQVAGKQQAEVDVENRTLRAASEFGNMVLPVLESGNTEQAVSMFQGHIEDLRAKGLPTQGAEQIMQQLVDGNSQGVIGAIGAVQENARGRGLLGTGQQSSARQREFENFLSIVQNPNSTQVEKDSANRALGNLAREVGSSAQTIASSPTTTTEVAGSQAEIAGAVSEATESAKLKKQLKHLPAIRKEVKLAEKAAAEQGEVLTDLARMEASLPGIKEAVSELIELSSIATSTFAGRIFDSAMKESGFGSTKGADARAKLIAIVDNQVLPLLKETFGAAFTVQEGENLKASLVDPNASPSQKREQLEAFLSQKERNIRTKQAQLGITSAENADVPETDLTNLSIEELIAERNRLGGQ